MAVSLVLKLGKNASRPGNLTGVVKMTGFANGLPQQQSRSSKPIEDRIRASHGLEFGASEEDSDDSLTEE